MRVWTSAIASTVFFAIAPAVVAGVIPWWLTKWQFRDASTLWAPVRVAAAVVVVAAFGVLVSAFLRFVVEGRGTPAPVAPTEHLVVGGLYRYVRNPMYLAVIAAIVGQAIVLWQVTLLWYAAVVGLAFVSFVKLYEEPTLARRYGVEYDDYRRRVPGWMPQWRR